MDTLKQVINNDPVPPVQMQPSLPRDVQIICLKCLEKDPAKRYAAAGELAADLRRFLDNKPILARATPAWERAWKWTRRHPTSAALIGVAALAVLRPIGRRLCFRAGAGCTSESESRRADTDRRGEERPREKQRPMKERLAKPNKSIGQGGGSRRLPCRSRSTTPPRRRERREGTPGQHRKCANEAMRNANAPEENAEKRSESSTPYRRGESLKQSRRRRTTSSRNSGRNVSPRFRRWSCCGARDPGNVACLQSSRFVKTHGNDPALVRDCGVALLRSGEINELLGRDDKAEEAYLAAPKLFDDLLKASPGNPDYRRNLAATWNDLAILRQKRAANRRRPRTPSPRCQAPDQGRPGRSSSRTKRSRKRELASSYDARGNLYQSLENVRISTRRRIIGKPLRLAGTAAGPYRRSCRSRSALARTDLNFPARSCSCRSRKKPQPSPS